jgi:hypothetical protein
MFAHLVVYFSLTSNPWTRLKSGLILRTIADLEWGGTWAAETQLLCAFVADNTALGHGNLDCAMMHLVFVFNDRIALLVIPSDSGWKDGAIAGLLLLMCSLWYHRKLLN